MARNRTPKYIEANDPPAERFREWRAASKNSAKRVGAASQKGDKSTADFQRTMKKSHDANANAALSEFRESIHKSLRRKGTR